MVMLRTIFDASITVKQHDALTQYFKLKLLYCLQFVVTKEYFVLARRPDCNRKFQSLATSISEPYSAIFTYVTA
jgi:hypothetical protein